MKKLFTRVALIVAIITQQTIPHEHQAYRLLTYDYNTLVNAFKVDKEKGARMWVDHITNMVVTPEEYRARMTPDSNPARMILEWIQDLCQGMNLAKEQLSVPAEIRALLNNNYTDVLTMTYSSNLTRSETAQAPLTIVELREMIVTHFMRIYNLIEYNCSKFSFDMHKAYFDDGLSQLLYGVCVLTLQRWAEHDLSRAELEILFEQQYQALTKIVPALSHCSALSRNNSQGKCGLLANITGALGSLGSAWFWIPSTAKMICEYGILGAIKSTHIPRVALDGLAAVLCLKQIPAPSKPYKDDIALNAIVCAGSLISLGLWAPAIYSAVMTQRVYFGACIYVDGLVGATISTHTLRAAIDILQASLSASRLYKAWKARQIPVSENNPCHTV